MGLPTLSRNPWAMDRLLAMNDQELKQILEGPASTPTRTTRPPTPEADPLQAGFEKSPRAHFPRLGVLGEPS